MSVTVPILPRPLRRPERSTLLLSLVLALSSVGPVSAGYDEGLAALGRDDLATAMMEFKPSGESGDARSQYRLGQVYLAMARPAELRQRSGPNLTQSAFWFLKAAEQGHVGAQRRMAEILRAGFGVEKDENRADDWDQRATETLKLQAEHGDAAAQWALADAYDRGLGTIRNYAEAVRLLEKVAVRGDAQALEYLGGHYAHGTGCQKDLVLAFVFFQLAERVAQRQTFERKLPWVRRQIFPTERFELNLSWVGGQISPSERAEAQSIADSWVPGMPLPVRTRRP